MTVRVRMRLESETLYLPELAPLVGKDVEIVINEQPSAEGGLTGRRLLELAGRDLVDPEAYKQLRGRSTI
jgi:hypothetical protein